MKAIPFLLRAMGMLCLIFFAPLTRAQTIPNSSFEINSYTVSPGYASGNGGTITGWVISSPGHTGLNLDGMDNAGLFANNGAIPDGTNVAFIQSNGTTNTLGTTITSLLPGATYTITFRANSRSGYAQPGAALSLNNGAFIPFTCFPAVGAENPYYTNSQVFIATSTTAPLVVQNFVESGQDGTLLLDDFTAQIAPVTLLHYRVNYSDAPTVATGVVPSLGILGNGTVSGVVTLTNDIPTTGMPAGAGDRSIVCNGSSGVLAPGTVQLNRTNIANAGGFTYEAWFKWNGGGNINSIIDYAGTEKLIRQASQTGLQMETDGTTFNLLGATSANQWHYAAVVFTATNAVSSTDSVSGYYTFYLDSNAPVAVVSNITINSLGDTLNSSIGVGMHPSGISADYFNGLIYEPRVSLGALAASNLLFKSTYLVTNLADSGPGTLRGAITGATNNGAVIQFAPALSGQTIVFSNTLNLNGDVVIDASELAQAITLTPYPGSNAVLSAVVGTTNVLNDLTFSNAFNIGSGSLYGGIVQNSGALIFNQCTFVSNSVEAGYGGAIYNGGTLTLKGCSLYGNTAYGSSGEGGSSGALYNNGAATLIQCTLAGNAATSGSGGAIFNAGTCALTQCTVCSNSASGVGGGIFTGTGSILTLNNTIVSGNTGPATDDLNANGATDVFVGTNVVRVFDSSGGSSSGTAPLNASPLLVSLGNYGGPTLTMPPLHGSPAVDGGSDTNASYLIVDQRGYPRILGAHVDIGAVEGIYNASGPGKFTGVTNIGSGSIELALTNFTDQRFLVLASTNITVTASNWVQIGTMTESPVGSGKYNYTDPQGANFQQRYYRARTP